MIVQTNKENNRFTKFITFIHYVKNLTFSGLIGMVCQPILTSEPHKYILILMFDLHWLQCPLDRAVSARNEQHFFLQ